MDYPYRLIRVEAIKRGIRRLCHFTPSRNLSYIAEDSKGILSAKHLQEDEKAIFNPTDLKRLDGYPDHVCCSIQYPNAWYFRIAREREALFRDWVVLFINERYLWREGVKFCPRNASKRHGRHVSGGIQAFKMLFAAESGSFRRKAGHPVFLPTDEQAEVLIPDQIERHDIIGIAVYDDAQAQRETIRLKLLGLHIPPIVIVPEFFDPGELSRQLRAGVIPTERAYQ